MQLTRDVTEYNFVDELSETQTMASCLSIWKTDDKVNQSRSIQQTGINSHSGKRWYRWKFDGSVGFRRTSTGKVMPYAINKHKVAVTTMPLLRQLNGHDIITGESKFFEEVKSTFGIKTASDLYPVMKFYELEDRDMFPQHMLPFMRHTEYADFIAATYGKKNFRKDLVKSAAGADIYALAYTRSFRNTVPVDWMVRFLRNNDAGLRFDAYANSEAWNTWNKLIPHIGVNSKRALLNEVWEVDTNREFQDTMRMVRQMNEERRQEFAQKRFRTLTEMHDEATPRYRAGGYISRTVQKNEKIEYSWDIENWHKVEAGNMIVVLAEETDEMTKWGTNMRNCIGSYKAQAVSETGIYGAVYRNDKLIGNFEIKDSKLKQLLGKANSKMAKEDIEVLEQWFKDREVGVESYWGKPTPDIKVSFQNVNRAAERAAVAINNLNIRLDGNYA